MIDTNTYQVLDPRNNFEPYPNAFSAGPVVYGSKLAVYAVESSVMAADEIVPGLVKKFVQEMQMKKESNIVYGLFGNRIALNTNSQLNNNNNNNNYRHMP